jgi:hypothetical protein
VRIAPKGTIISGVVNFEVMIRIDSPAGLLKPDMTANVSIRTAQREALVLPNATVQREGSERYVWMDRRATDWSVNRRSGRHQRCEASPRSRASVPVIKRAGSVPPAEAAGRQAGTR